MFTWLIALIISVSIQIGTSIRYDITTTPPQADMLAIGSPVAESVLNVSTMQIEHGTVSGYVVWTGLPRQSEYYVTLPSGGVMITPRNRAEG